jgi:hypothetical protein
MARFKTVEATVVGLKFEPLQRANLIVLEVTQGVQLHCLCPFEHLLEEGDKVALEIEVPLKLEKINSRGDT